MGKRQSGGGRKTSLVEKSTSDHQRTDLSSELTKGGRPAEVGRGGGSAKEGSSARGEQKNTQENCAQGGKKCYRAQTTNLMVKEK